MPIKVFYQDETCKTFNSLSDILKPKDVKALYCQRNNLTSLAGLERCINLEELYAYDNDLTSIKEIGNCPKLKNMFINSNKITSLEGIERCPKLLVIECSTNLIEHVSGIENCKELIHLYCEDNPLFCLTGVECCPNLEEILIDIEHLPGEQLDHYGHLIPNYENPILFDSQSIEPERPLMLSEFAAKLIYDAQCDKECPITFEPLKNYKEVYVNLCGHIVSPDGKELNSCPVCRERTLYTKYIINQKMKI
jgi:hypothetical protein